jgi:FKBP-type peptidyl-prolyl cis-trans isomerase FkpA
MDDSLEGGQDPILRGNVDAEIESLQFFIGSATTGPPERPMALCNCLLYNRSSSPSPDTRNNMAITTTASGLQYEEITVGEGAEAQAGQNVTVHYTGWLQNADGSAGSKFDSSKDRNDPFEFPLGAGRVIKGWDEGVQGMKIGGKRKLIIPAELGYGARGAGGAIPPNATLIFDVELLGL